MPTELPPLSQIGTGLRLPKIFAPLRRKSTHKPIAKQGSDELRPFLMPQAGSLHSIEIEGNSRNNTLNFRRRSDESRRSALTYPGIRQHLECGNTMRDRLNKELQYVKASQDRLEATQAKMLHVMKAMQKDQLESTENMTNIINDFSKRCAKEMYSHFEGLLRDFMTVLGRFQSSFKQQASAVSSGNEKSRLLGMKVEQASSQMQALKVDLDGIAAMLIAMESRLAATSQLMLESAMVLPPQSLFGREKFDGDDLLSLASLMDQLKASGDSQYATKSLLDSSDFKNYKPKPAPRSKKPIVAQVPAVTSRTESFDATEQGDQVHPTTTKPISKRYKISPTICDDQRDNAEIILGSGDHKMRLSKAIPVNHQLSRKSSFYGPRDNLITNQRQLQNLKASPLNEACPSPRHRHSSETDASISFAENDSEHLLSDAVSSLPTDTADYCTGSFGRSQHFGNPLSYSPPGKVSTKLRKLVPVSRRLCQNQLDQSEISTETQTMDDSMKIEVGPSLGKLRRKSQ